MNLVVHQLKIEFRRQAFLLAAYALVLVASWAVVAGHLGGIQMLGVGFTRIDSAVPTLVFFGFCIAFPALIGACILADSPI